MPPLVSLAASDATDAPKVHPEIVARLTKLTLDWKATLHAKPNLECLTKQPVNVTTSPTKKSLKGVTPEVRLKAFAFNRSGYVSPLPPGIAL